MPIILAEEKKEKATNSKSIFCKLISKILILRQKV
jgi:hypothetical protein